MRNKILSLLVLLLTAATGAWAAKTVVMPGLMAPTDNSTEYSAATWTWVQIWGYADNFYMDYEIKENSQFAGENFKPTRTQLINALKAVDLHICGSDGKVSTVQLLSADGTVLKTAEINKALTMKDDDTRAKVPPTFFAEMTTDKDYIIRVNLGECNLNWDAENKKGTFTMPAFDMVLTPIYSKATIYDADGVTEKAAYESFKEAFLAVQDGEVIKLDDNVTVTSKTDLMTGNRATEDPVKFTIDFNGYVLDGSSAGGTFINTNHDGDEIRFIDSSTAQTGGLKGVLSGKTNSLLFESGRYSFNGLTAAEIKEIWSTGFVVFGYTLPENYEFVDIENAPDANGFMVTVGLAAFELTIPAGEYATYYSDKNVKLHKDTPEGIGLYTVGSVNDDKTAVTLKELSGIVLAGTPMLVYNSTDKQETVKLQYTSDMPTNSLMWYGGFKGTLTATTIAASTDDVTNYALNGKQFVWVKDALAIGANKCYLSVTTGGTLHAPALNIVFGETTKITNTNLTNLTNGDWYDLNGRKLNAKPTKKGVYIMNGRKVVVK